MSYKDPERQKEYYREWRRQKRRNDPEWVERYRQYQRGYYSANFTRREDSKLRSYLSKCRQRGRLNDE